MNLEELLAQARVAIDKLVRVSPDVTEIESIRIQLDYLRGYLAGENDGRRIGDMNFGLLAVREIEPRDPTTAEILYELAERLRLMQGESGWPK